MAVGFGGAEEEVERGAWSAVFERGQMDGGRCSTNTKNTSTQ